jgi:hypothetical protein
MTWAYRLCWVSEVFCCVAKLPLNQSQCWPSLVSRSAKSSVHIVTAAIGKPKRKNRALSGEFIISIVVREGVLGTPVHEIGRKLRVLLKKASTSRRPAIIPPFEQCSFSAEKVRHSGFYPTLRRDFAGQELQ